MTAADADPRGKEMEDLRRENEELRARLQRSERRVKATFEDNVAFAIIVTDGTGHVTDWNAGASRILGWSAAEMYGQSIERIFTPEDRSAGRVSEERAAALADGRTEDERWHLRKSGQRFFASGEIMRLRGEDGQPPGFVKILRDRTEGHRAGVSLRKAEMLLRRAQEVGGVGIFDLDLDSNLLYPTPEFCRLYGLPERDCFPTAVIENLVHPDDVTLRSDVGSRRRGDAIGGVAYRIGRADTGEERWIERKAEIERDETGRPSRFVGTVRDITDQVHAKKALVAEREQLAQLFEQATTFMALLRGPDHRIERVNPGYTRLIGGRNVVGKTVAEALPDAVEQGYLHLLDEVFQSGTPFVASGSKYVVRASPDSPVHERYVDFVYQPILDAGGSVSGIFIEGADVTARTLAAIALRENEERHRVLLDNIAVGYCTIEVKFDAGGKPVDYRFLEVNPAFEQQTGLTGTVGRWVRDLVPGHEQHWFDIYGDVASTGVPKRFESGAVGLGRWFDVHAIRVGPPEARQVSTLFRDISERRHAERRQAALLHFIDQLRDLTDPDDIAYAGCEALGTTLGASLVGYGTIDGAAETIAIERDWSAPGATSLAGMLRFADYGSYINDLKAGTTVVVADPAGDPRTQAHADALKALGAHAFVNMPLFEGGRFVALLYVCFAETHAFSEPELALIRDVAERTRSATERSRATRALRESEEQFRVFAQAVPNHIWASRPDGHLDWFNSQAYAYSGMEPGSLDGSSAWGAVVHPDDLPAAGAAWARSLASGDVYEAEFRIRREDGAFRWFLVRAEPVRDAAGRITRWVGTNTDIDERRRQAAALATLNATLEEEVEKRTRERDRVWSTTSDLMALAGLDGYLKTVNPAWTRMLGWDTADLLATPFIDLVDPDDHAETRLVVAKLAAQEAVTNFVDRIVRKGGGTRTIMWDAIPNGEVFHIVGRDITALRQTEEQLRQSQKMEAVGQLTGGLAHDFNNLLTGITGSLDLMSSRIAQGRYKDIERYTAAAQGAAKRAAALTHRLLAFSRQQTLDPKPTDINRLIAGMEELIRRTVGPAVDLETVAAGGLWTTLVDPNQLENALLNLCINARDAMPDGGRLTIETANRWLDARAAGERELSPGQYVSLCVSDTGTGMPPDIIAKAFDPFFTTKPIGQGTGLGLSMIYGFARQSDGQVRIYSEPGHGTMVCIYLPRHFGSAEEPERPGELAGAPRADAGETVLVVDDEPTVRMLVMEVLEELGYAAIEAADGAAGLKVLQSEARIDLLVTDVGLPGGMNGRQMADAARVARPELAVLFITGFAENAVVGNGHLEPGMHVMTKPFAMEALASRIRDLIVGR